MRMDKFYKYQGEIYLIGSAGGDLALMIDFIEVHDILFEAFAAKRMEDGLKEAQRIVHDVKKFLMDNPYNDIPRADCRLSG